MTGTQLRIETKASSNLGSSETTMEETATSTEAEGKDIIWCRETVPQVFKVVCSSLPLSLSQAELVSLLLVSPWFHRTLVSSQPLWQVPLLFSSPQHSSFSTKVSIFFSVFYFYFFGLVTEFSRVK